MGQCEEDEQRITIWQHLNLVESAKEQKVR